LTFVFSMVIMAGMKNESDSGQEEEIIRYTPGKFIDDLTNYTIGLVVSKGHILSNFNITEAILLDNLYIPVRVESGVILRSDADDFAIVKGHSEKIKNEPFLLFGRYFKGFSEPGINVDYLQKILEQPSEQLRSGRIYEHDGVLIIDCPVDGFEFGGGISGSRQTDLLTDTGFALTMDMVSRTLGF
jgi:hypothetical protein